MKRAPAEKPITAADRARWVEEMPVLAAIRPIPPVNGKFVRQTEWGALYLDGNHYTLVTGEHG